MINQAIRTHHRLSILFAVAVLAVAVAVAGCGSSGNGSSSSSAAPAANPSAPPTGAAAASCGSSSSASAASEAASTAQGDIPDNQNFLTFKNTSGGYSISYPEGWARSGNGNDVTFRNMGNTITIQVVPGPRPTPASVTAELKTEAADDPCLTPAKPQVTP